MGIGKCVILDRISKINTFANFQTKYQTALYNISLRVAFENYRGDVADHQKGPCPT